MLNISKLPLSLKRKIKTRLNNEISITKPAQNKIKPKNMPEYKINNNDNYISFDLLTRAIPKGRPRLVINKELLKKALAMGINGYSLAIKSFSIKTPKETKIYESWISYCGIKAMKNKKIIDCYFFIDVKISNPEQYSDIDNCLKSIMDGLNKIVYKDDKKVRKASITFIEGEPNVSVNINLIKA